MLSPYSVQTSMNRASIVVVFATEKGANLGLMKTFSDLDGHRGLLECGGEIHARLETSQSISREDIPSYPSS